MRKTVDNVLLIVIDALRRDFVTAYQKPTEWGFSHPTQLTPTIDKLSTTGERFDNAFACINATDPSMTTIRSGQFPARHGIRNHGRRLTINEQEYAAAVPSFPEFLPTHRTIAVDTMGRWHKRGFDKYIVPQSRQKSTLFNIGKNMINTLPSFLSTPIKPNLKKYVMKKQATGNRSVSIPHAEDITTTFLENFPNESDNSWVGLLHFWDTHSPYQSIDKPTLTDDIDYQYYDDNRDLKRVIANNTAGEWSEALKSRHFPNEETIGDVVKRVVAGARYVDEQIARLVKELKSRGIRNETAIILTSDHGESFTENDIIFSHHGLYDPTIHVPFVINAPDFSGDESRFVQHVDIAPTILDLLGVDYETRLFDGVSLASKNGREKLSNRNGILIEERSGETKQAYRTGDWKYIRSTNERENCRYCQRKHGGQKELYNLDHDPCENVNMIGSNQEKVRVRKMDAKLDEWLQSIPNPKKEQTNGNEMEKEALQRLDDLGYI